MIPRPPRSTLTDTRLPYTTLFRSPAISAAGDFLRTSRAVPAGTSICWSNGSGCYHSRWRRSEEHTSELPSLMRISYAVFCLKNKNIPHVTTYLLHTSYITTLHHLPATLPA